MCTDRASAMREAVQKAFFVDSGQNDEVVNDALQGLAMTRPWLCRLPDSPGAMLEANPPANTVAVLSGGGAGHEPLAAGFVGPGALSGAVSGDIFAAPPSASVLDAIRHLHAAQATTEHLHVLSFHMQGKKGEVTCMMTIAGDWRITAGVELWRGYHELRRCCTEGKSRRDPG